MDQEAEYQNSIIIIRKMMNHPNVISNWYQVPLYLTNATSYKDCFLYAWGENEKWIRNKEFNSIHNIEKKYPKRFYKFFEWHENQQEENTAVLIGLRTEESLNRFRAVAKNPGYKNILWSTKTKNRKSVKFYPIYDWGMGDIWKYIYDNKVEYNRIYDLMFKKNKNFYNTFRVSNLIHEKSFKCLLDLQELEPQTFDKLTERIMGVHTAGIYASEKIIYSVEKLPKAFKTWLLYRNHLFETCLLDCDKKERIKNRFEKQEKSENVYKQQCKQLVLGDWENTFTIKKTNKKRIQQNLEKWREIL